MKGLVLVVGFVIVSSTRHSGTRVIEGLVPLLLAILPDDPGLPPSGTKSGTKDTTSLLFGLAYFGVLATGIINVAKMNILRRC